MHFRQPLKNKLDVVDDDLWNPGMNSIPPTNENKHR